MAGIEAYHLKKYGNSFSENPWMPSPAQIRISMFLEFLTYDAFRVYRKKQIFYGFYTQKAYC
ncbi:hypothetical protein ACILE9_05745 [Capnocytophaga cynodegmi]|uniref:hypothetical protein n=1 Tax=Capnocytophaga cynodegmi TaxID=28189 RepID=UPI0037D32BF5